MAKTDSPFLQLLANWLFALRKRLNMTQVQLACFLGIYPEAISRWENALQAPSATNLLNIMGLATEDERMALLDRIHIDDVLKDDMGDHLQFVQCEECGRHMGLRDFTRLGWPAPPMIRKQGDPYAVKMCPPCQRYTSKG